MMNKQSCICVVVIYKIAQTVIPSRTVSKTIPYTWVSKKGRIFRKKLFLPRFPLLFLNSLMRGPSVRMFWFWLKKDRKMKIETVNSRR